MDSIEKKIDNYAVVLNINLLRATLNEAAEFKDYLAQAILETDKDIIVNLSNCEHLDSTFLGVLVSSFKKLKTQNRNLLIIEPTDKSSIFLTLNSIGKIFPLYNSVNSALEDIENKKILENEINELGDDGKKKDKHSNKTTSKISNKPVVEPKEEPKPTPEEIIPTETIQVESLNVKKEKLPIKPPLDQPVPPKNKPDLIKNENGLGITRNTFKLKSDEHSSKENASNYTDSKKDKYDDKPVSKGKTFPKEKSLSGERVEWEFGFN
jgi:anti-anti-sigma factor